MLGPIGQEARAGLCGAAPSACCACQAQALDPDCLQVSWRELSFAEQQGSAFSVLRVYGSVGGAAGEVSLLRIIDPARLWRQNVVSVSITV